MRRAVTPAVSGRGEKSKPWAQQPHRQQLRRTDVPVKQIYLVSTIWCIESNAGVVRSSRSRRRGRVSRSRLAERRAGGKNCLPPDDAGSATAKQKCCCLIRVGSAQSAVSVFQLLLLMWMWLLQEPLQPPPWPPRHPPDNTPVARGTARPRPARILRTCSRLAVAADCPAVR